MIDEKEENDTVAHDIEEKKKLASHILDNNGSRDQLVSQVVKLLEGGDSCARD